MTFKPFLSIENDIDDRIKDRDRDKDKDKDKDKDRHRKAKSAQRLTREGREII